MISIFHNANGQITSKSYELLLKGLLSGSVESISCENLDSGKADFVILDTRSKEEFEVSRIEGAIWVGYDEFDLTKIQSIDPMKTVVVYCSVGYRSEKIGEQLLESDFAKVYNLSGGIFEWINQGYPVVDTNSQTTELIHGYSKTWGIWVNKGEKVYH